MLTTDDLDLETDSRDACLRQLQDALNQVNIELQSTGHQAIKLNVFAEQIEPIKKLYLHKCDQNQSLRHHLKTLRNKLAT